MNLGTIILAAGASLRMGQSKVLLPWGHGTVIGHLIRQWGEVGATQIAVVCAAGDAALHVELDRLASAKHDRILNPQPERGMFSSVQCAAQWDGWEPSLTDWAIALGDQPHLRLSTLRALLEFRLAHPDTICQPSYGGRARHPVLLPRAAFEELRHCGAATLKDFLSSAACPLACCLIDDPGLALDLDRPEDYRKAVQLYACGA